MTSTPPRFSSNGHKETLPLTWWRLVGWVGWWLVGWLAGLAGLAGWLAGWGWLVAGWLAGYGTLISTSGLQA